MIYEGFVAGEVFRARPSILIRFSDIGAECLFVNNLAIRARKAIRCLTCTIANRRLPNEFADAA